MSESDPDGLAVYEPGDVMTMDAPEPDPPFLPFHDWILVECISEEFSPGTMWTNPPQGRVVACGPGRVKESGLVVEPALEAGTIIHYVQGMKLRVAGHDYELCAFGDVLGIVPATSE